MHIGVVVPCKLHLRRLKQVKEAGSAGHVTGSLHPPLLC